MTVIGRTICDRCNIRIPVNRPKLVCTHCNVTKHYKCQNLSKNDAFIIINSMAHSWICKDCIVTILPINACARAKATTNTASKFKAQCNSCGGHCYNPLNIMACPWCDLDCHKKCINNILGCNNCCDNIIPGFRVHNYDLLGNIEQVNNKIFNPYSHTSNVNLIGDIIANEQENNTVWNDISDHLINCNYKQPNKITFSKNTELNVLSLNIRSLHKNISSIVDNLSEYQKYDVICLNETNCNINKLANGLSDLLIEGFHPPIFQAPARSTCRGGGLVTYVNQRVCAADDIEKLNNIPEPSPDGEFLFIKIKNCRSLSKSVIIGNVYRSPSSTPVKFNELFGTVFHNIRRHNNKQILIAGDFNVDLIKYDRDISSQDLIELTTNHGFIQLISRPTRVTDHSATLIDHIYTNKICSTVHSSVVTVDLSDHLATLATISLDGNFDQSQRLTNRHNDTETCEFRMFNDANNEKFKQLIAEENWESLDGLDAQSSYDTFVAIYTKLYDTAYPLNTKRTRRKNERVKPKPWILSWLEEACARKNRLYYEFIKNPTPANKTKYNKMKKFVDKHTKLAKSRYYKKYFEQYSDNSRKQWQMINNLLNRNNKKISIPKLQDNDGVVYKNPTAIAEKFNDYFCNIASNLKSQFNFSCETSDFEKTLPEPVSNSIFIKPAITIEVTDIINNLKNKATMDSKISALKFVSTDNRFIQTLTNVINLSFEQGVFPQSLKLARVVPVYKNGAKTAVCNYRPISLLASFSKIYEKLMHKRIVNFMEANNSLYEMQYGFRTGRSCEHAVLKAQSLLLDSLNKNQIALLLLIDFSKAFDMVEHSVLLKKLYHYGIRGNAYNWLKSYLDNREQYVSVNGANSCKNKITYGVPQGSILGPLLFVIYINDMPNICNFAKFILYADDANIILTGKDLHDIENQLLNLTSTLLQWVNVNGLLLNLKKTNYMIFSRRRIDRDIFTLTMANVRIERKSEARFLGVLIDDKLAWSQHIATVKLKMSRYIGIMYKIKGLLPIQARLQLYHSFVQSHINFCCLVWGFSTKSNIESLFASQKKGMRAAMPGYINYFYKDGLLPTHTKSSFNKFKVLTVHAVIVKFTLIFLHKVYNLPHLVPSSVRETIASDAPTLNSNHETSSEWLNIYGTNTYRKSVFFKGPLIYINSETIQCLTAGSTLSINSYKNNVKRGLLKLQSEGDKVEWQPDNFLLYNIRGLRNSQRLNNLFNL